MLQTVEFVINFSQIETLSGGTATLHHEVQALDVLRLEIPARAAGTTVELVPPSSVLHFLGIFKTSGEADEAGENVLHYSVGADSRRFLLQTSMPHFISSPLITMLQPAPERLNFYNDSDEPIDVLILVGRDAAAVTPPTPPQPPTK